jgi:hypothetical protein
MKYLKYISSIGALFALVLGLTFSASFAQVNNNNNNNMQNRMHNNPHGKTFMLQGKVVGSQSGQAVSNAKVMLMKKNSSSYQNSNNAMRNDTSDTTNNSYQNNNNAMGNDTTTNMYQGNQRNQTMRSDSDTTNYSYQNNQAMGNDTSTMNNNSNQSAYQSNPGNNMTATTGQDGTFKLKNIPAGTYTLKVTDNNYKTWKQQVTIKQDGYRTIHLNKSQ